MSIPSGSLVQALNDPIVYYIENGQRRGVPTGDILSCLGGANTIIQIEQAQLNVFPDGGVKHDCTKSLDPAASALGWSKSYYSANDETYFNGAQHLETRVWLGPDGLIQGFYKYKNDSMIGWCGGVVIAVYDSSASSIQVFTPPSGCISGKPPGQEVNRKEEWSDRVRPEILGNVRGLGVKAYWTNGNDHATALANAITQVAHAAAAAIAAG